MPRRKLLSADPVDAGGTPVGVREIIRHSLATDARFNSDYDGIRLACRIADACDGGKHPEPMFIDEGDWQKLCDALRSPAPLRGSAPYFLSPAHRQLPLVTSVFDAAKEEDPPKKPR